jgi:tRNA(Ile)-lysidine synthase TilS/MesJ
MDKNLSNHPLEMTETQGEINKNRLSETDNSPKYKDPVNSILKKYRKEIWGPFTAALRDYRMIQAGDKIAVCMSGGKDSALLGVLLKQLQRHSDVPYELEFIAMDPGYNPANRELLLENCRKLDLPVKMFETNIFSVAEKQEKNPCYLCARMRRGHLYSYAQSLGCNKIALGHHFSDVIETTLMGMLWGSQIQGMLPKLHSTNYPGMELIRPMYKIHEDAIIAWARYNDLHFLQCACLMTEKSAVDEDASKRRETKRLIAELKKTNPDVEKNIFNAIHRANVDTLVGYKLDNEQHSFLDKYTTE